MAGTIDGNMALVVSGGLFLITGIFTMMFAMIFVVAPRARLKKRMTRLGLTSADPASAVAKGGNPGQRRVQEKLRELRSRGKNRARRQQIRNDLIQAGFDMSIKRYFAMLGAVGLAVAAVYLILGYPPAGALPVGLAGGYLLPKLVLKFIAKKRQKIFVRDFSGALDIIVRGVRTGLPVGECLTIVASEMPDSVGEEFNRIVEGQKMGLTMDELMRRGLERMPVPEFKFFSIVLQVQLQTGGSLAETLENLSNVLRERKKMRDKVQAMSSEAKSSAAIIGALPFFVAGALSAMKGDYLAPLFDFPLGRVLFYGGVAWMGIGVLVMKKMINFKM